MLRVNVNIADIRAKPRFKSERVTQALFNEPIELLQHGENYSLVRLPDGYNGFIYNGFMSDDSPSSGTELKVQALLAPGYRQPHRDAEIVTRLPFTATVWAHRHCATFWVSHTSRYGQVYLAADDLCDPLTIPPLTAGNMQRLVHCAYQFIGVPYLWGGKSFFGLDCSGFVQLIYSFFGIALPRDTKDQINAGKKIEREQIRPGDLLFFRRHVAIAVSATKYIHSSITQGGVYVNSLDPADSNYLRQRDLELQAVRRIVNE